jgi:pentatricopeptide repeat protein
VAFNHVIEQCLRHGLVEVAWKLFGRARELGVPLDMPCCNHLLASLGPLGQRDAVDQVLTYLAQSGLRPTEVTFACAIWATLEMKDFAHAARLVSVSRLPVSLPVHQGWRLM